MIRRLLRLALLLGVLGGIAIALTKLLGNQAHDAPALAPRPSGPWPRLESDPTVSSPPVARAVPDEAAPAARPPSVQTSAQAWVASVDGACPATHPVKAKLASKIFHLPGMANYERTIPDRCYVDAASAEADGLRVAKR